MFHTDKKRNNHLTRGLSKRGQFTIFVILGIVVLSVFGLAIYARLKILNSQIEKQADTQLKNYLSNNAINQYVTSCLDVVTDEAILLATMQGGILNSSDKKKNIDYIEYTDSRINRTFNVSILVDANYNCIDNRLSGYIVTHEPGPYPYACGNYYIKNLPKLYTTYGHDCKNNCTDKDFFYFSGFFGINNLSILCDPKGANAPGIISGSNTCEYYDYYSKSMQKQLEEKIANDMNICINLTDLLSKTPSNITQVGDVNASIQFNQKGFSVKLKYPFTITLRNRQPVTKLVEFSVYKDTQFKELYEYTYELLNYDVKDASFELVRDRDKVISKGLHQTGVNLYTSDFEIKVIDGDESNNFIRMIQVVNTKNNLLGVPLTMNFGIKNRRPALEYIHDGNSQLYDIIGMENHTTIISPIGYDPDDEQVLVYTYNGWLEEYIDYYNWSDSECSKPTSLEYISANCTKRSNTIDPKHSWTTSQLFIDTQRNASYSPSYQDVGFHDVIITVYDRFGLYDFQKVRILVFDMPVAKINGTNYYEDVDDTRASYEDMYLLNGSESSVGAISSVMDVGFAEFMWYDSLEPFEIRKIITEAYSSRALLIPNDTETPSPLFNIMNITEYIFRKKTPSYDKYEIHNISLTVKTGEGLTDTNKIYVNVTRCLNHSSNVPIYPFDTLDPFNIAKDDTMGHLMANHTCCGDDMDYQDKDFICYNLVNYGYNNSFEDYSKLPDASEYSLKSNTEKAPSGSKYDNDIFSQIFTAKCSGDRGNVCTGARTDERKIIDPCEDYNNKKSNPAFSLQRCSGPVNKKVSDTPMQCYNYSEGHSFEYDILGSSDNAICTDGKQCATGNSGTFKAYSSTGTFKYECSGLCDGGGKCNKASNDCTCFAGCGATGVSPLCNGVEYPGDSDVDHMKSCSNFGKTYFADVCDDCGLKDSDDNICRGPDFGEGCNADLECNNRPRNSVFEGEDMRCVEGTNKRAKCESTCKMTEDISDKTCRTKGPGCKGPDECDGVIHNDKITGSDNKYCDSECVIHTCPPGQEYDKISEKCNTDCTKNYDRCLLGYTCCTEAPCSTSSGTVSRGTCYLKTTMID